MARRMIPLGSGSRGNATLLEFESTRLMIDAGLSARDLGNRLQAVGVEPASITAILLTHEHHDHVRGAERFSKLHKVPIAATRDTLTALKMSELHFHGWIPLAPGASGHGHDFEGVTATPFPVSHDAADPVGYVLEQDGARVAIVTDLGVPTALVVERLKGCRVVMIESNHDAAMLRAGPYPWHLKQRVGSRLGHLSNDEAAAILSMAVGSECHGVILAHLSEKNNSDRLALETAKNAVDRSARSRIEWRVAGQKEPCEPVTC